MRNDRNEDVPSMTTDQVGMLSFVAGMMFMVILDLFFNALLGG